MKQDEIKREDDCESLNISLNSIENSPNENLINIESIIPMTTKKQARKSRQI